MFKKQLYFIFLCFVFRIFIILSLKLLQFNLVRKLIKFGILKCDK